MPNVIRPIIAALVAVAPCASLAQEQTASANQVAAQPARSANPDSVPVLVYSVNRAPDRPFDTSRQVTVITADEIARRGPDGFYDLLREAGVYMSATNPQGTSQVAAMRGWEGKDILVLVDGVQVNNALYRFNLNQIDPAMIDRVEIVKGVGSVLGSEALGGIINIVTKRGPARGENGAFHAFATTRYQGGSQALSQSGEVYGQTSNFRYRVGGSYRDHSDLELGAKMGTLYPSAFTQRSLNGNLDWFVNNDRTLSASFWGQQMRPPRTDRYIDRTYLEYYEPEFDRSAQLRYNDLTDRGWQNMLQITAYYHRDEEGMQRIDVNRPNIYTDRPTTGNLAGLNVEMGSVLFDSHSLVYGVDATNEKVHSTLTNTNLTTGAVTTGRGHYTDGSTFGTAAAYIQDRITLGRIVPTVGVRYARFRSTGYENTASGEYDLDHTNSGLSASLNTLIIASNSVHFVANVVSGFRAPNIDDLSTIERRVTGLEVPNPGLMPEKVMTYEAGVKIAREHYGVDAFYYYSDAKEVIKRGPGVYQGKTWFDANNNGVKDGNELNIIQKQNIGNFRMSGPELAAHVNPTSTVKLYGNYFFTVGRDVDAKSYLFRLPPANGTNGIRWTPDAARAPWVDVVHNWAAAQRRLSPEDSVDVRIGRDGTDGYNVFSVRGGLDLLDRVPLYVGVENVFNQRYQYHGTAGYQPGREFVVSLRYGL
ncbi:MAG TPA: TonB-dependent receptor [Gemmatimonadaceae bacterium]|nr:TonB-dependent receptor [Gemmatimonadaceae bacterium]